LLPLLIHPDRLNDAALVETIVGMAQRIGRDGFLRQQNAILTRADSVPDLPNFACPALVIVGREDALTPPERAEEIAAGLPNARLEVLENCGHLATLEQPDQVNALFEQFFLEETGA
jgi:pimeloyl-ACP methyl ester carboxylesterase